MKHTTLTTTARTKTGLDIPVTVTVLSNGRLEATAGGYPCKFDNKKINIDSTTVKALIGATIPADCRADIFLIEDMSEKIHEARTWLMHNSEVCVHYDTNRHAEAYSISVDGEYGLFGEVEHILLDSRLQDVYGESFQNMADVRRDVSYYLWGNHDGLNAEYTETGILSIIHFENMAAFEIAVLEALTATGRLAALQEKKAAAMAKKAEADAEVASRFAKARETGESVALDSWHGMVRGKEAMFILYAEPNGTTRKHTVILD